MKEKRVNVLWGAILILIGGALLAAQLGLIADLSAILWAGLFAGASVLFFITYFAAGAQQWGWLIPACITAGLAGTILLGNAGAGKLAGAVFMASVSLPFWLVFLVNRQHWWALIPAWATAIIAAVILLADNVPGQIVASLILLGTALPFFVVYLLNREHWWALIPGTIVGGVALVVLFTLVAGGEAIGALVLAMVALPFLYIYLRFSEQWWALIPGGIILSTAAVVLLAGLRLAEGVEGRILGGTLFLGIALTFGWLWWRRKEADTDWAKYPAAVFLFLTLLVVVLSTTADLILPAALILIGLWMLYDSQRRSKLKG